VDKILALPPKTKVMILAPVVRRQKGEFRDVFERLAREGFVRVRVDGEMLELGEQSARIKLDKKKFHTIEAVVDRLVMDDKIRVRLGDSTETALRWGDGVMFTLHQLPEAAKVPGPK
jgi:excinuclease ABC subunit A